MLGIKKTSPCELEKFRIFKRYSTSTPLLRRLPQISLKRIGFSKSSFHGNKKRVRK